MPTPSCGSGASTSCPRSSEKDRVRELHDASAQAYAERRALQKKAKLYERDPLDCVDWPERRLQSKDSNCDAFRASADSFLHHGRARHSGGGSEKRPMSVDGHLDKTRRQSGQSPLRFVGGLLTKDKLGSIANSIFDVAHDLERSFKGSTSGQVSDSSLLIPRFGGSQSTLHDDSERHREGNDSLMVLQSSCGAKTIDDESAARRLARHSPPSSEPGHLGYVLPSGSRRENQIVLTEELVEGRHSDLS